MEIEPATTPSNSRLWKARSETIRAETNLELVLIRGARIPMKYWRPNFRFMGLGDETLHRLTDGAFPKKLEPGKKHPLLSLERLAHGVGFKVCPCSSQKPFNARTYRFIRKGCRLLHTDETVDRNSYLVENVTLNIPPSMYRDMKFKGEVPETCIERISV